MTDWKFTPPHHLGRNHRDDGSARYRLLHHLLIAAGCIIAGIILGLLLAMRECHADEWAPGDKWLLGSYAMLSAYDAAQTDQGIRSGKFMEMNPLFGERPSTERIIVTKVALGGAIYWLADRYAADRRLILLLANALVLGAVAHNASIGMRVVF